MIRRLLHSLAAVLTLSLSPAIAGPPGELVQLDILPGWERADGSRVAGLHIKLPAGWKTYWRAPGDAGIPPVFDLTGSANIQTIEPEWPTPRVFSQNGMTSVGYRDGVVVPVILTPATPGAPITLSGQLQIGICKDICMPAELDFDAVFAPGTGAADPAIRAALADRPMTGAEAGLGRIACTLSVTPDGLALEAEFLLPATGGDEYAVVETRDPEVWVAEAETRRDGNRLHVRTEMMHVEGGAFALDRSGIRITVLGSRDAVDIQGCPAP